MSYPENLRALSIAGAYPWLIATGEKPAECRNWPIDSYRGLVLLHNSSSTAWDDSWHQIIADGDVTRQQAKAMKGHIIGCAFLTGCDHDLEDPEGFLHWMEGSALFAPEDWQPAPGARNYWRAQKPAQQQAFSRAWKLIQAGQYQAANPDRTTELLVEHGHQKPRIFIAGPGGHITTNTGA